MGINSAFKGLNITHTGVRNMYNSLCKYNVLKIQCGHFPCYQDITQYIIQGLYFIWQLSFVTFCCYSVAHATWIGCANVIEVSQQVSNKIMIQCMYYVNLLTLTKVSCNFSSMSWNRFFVLIQNLALFFTVSQLLSGTAVLGHARKYANLFVVTT
jgi:hypothetical protein